MKKLFVSFLCLCLMFPIVYVKNVSADTNKPLVSNSGVIYYVDSENGNDSNKGTSEGEAWQSLKKVNASEYNPGDTILLKRGSVFNYQHLWIKNNGTKGNPIIVSAYGEGEKPKILSMNDAELSGDTEITPVDTTVYAVNAQYVVFDSLYINNKTPGTGSQHSVFFDNKSTSSERGYTRDITVSNCTIFGSADEYWSTNSRKGLAGITVSSYLDGVLIENNEISNCKENGITVNGFYSGCDYNGVVNELSGKNVVIRNNYLYNIGCDGVLTNNCYKPLVEYNVANKTHSYSVAAEVAFWPFACYGALFQYNEAFNTQTMYDGQGFDCDYQCYNTTFQYNYSHNNSGGFMLICNEAKNWNGGYSFNVNPVVRYNISQNDYYNVFTLSGDIENVMIYNNTIFGKWNNAPNGSIIFTFSKGANTLTGRSYMNNVSFMNNLIYTNNTTRFSWNNSTDIKWINNLYCATGYYCPKNGLVNNSADKGKFVCSQCEKCFNMEQFTVVDEAAGTYTCPDCLQECTVSEVLVNEFTSSGNIYSKDPLLVAPGTAGTGISTCDGYMLYENSPCIGAGVVVDESQMLYKSTTDYFGNAIPSVYNIGAYQGTGKSCEKEEFIDGRYRMLLDFEAASDTAKETAIPMITASSTWLTKVTLEKENGLVGTDYGSTKSVKINNTKTTSSDAFFDSFLGYGSLENSYGITFYANGGGTDARGRITLGNYMYKFTVPANGGYVNIRWDNTFIYTMTGKGQKVDAEVFRAQSKIKFGVVLEPNASAYFDDVLADMFTNEQMPSTTVPTTEPPSTTVKDYPQIDGFTTARIINTFDDYEGVDGCTYLKYGEGQNAYNLHSFSCYKSLDTYDYSGGRYNGISLGSLDASDATALRFWYKSGSTVNVQLRASSFGQPEKDYSFTLPASSAGEWYTLELDTITSAGKSLSNMKYMFLKASTVYIDEVHTLKPLVKGDVNRDNEVNVKDVLLLKKYKTAHPVIVDKVTADVNADGIINVKDILALLSKLA